MEETMYTLSSRRGCSLGFLMNLSSKDEWELSDRLPDASRLLLCVPPKLSLLPLPCCGDGLAECCLVSCFFLPLREGSRIRVSDAKLCTLSRGLLPPVQ